MNPVTKMIVSNTIEVSERVRWQEFGGQSKKKKPKKKFENLFKIKPRGGAVQQQGVGSGRGIDQIREIHYNQPIELRGPNPGDFVRVTAIDANHCPGSCMFLFQGTVNGTERSCLVTGDLRAEPWFIETLLHNPLLSPFIVSTNNRRRRPLKELDCIYLDTSNVLLNQELLTKQQAVEDLIELIKLYPSTTRFFLNCWTWGYEELLKGIYKEFSNNNNNNNEGSDTTTSGGGLIHLDWYKHRIYTSNIMRNSDPLLASLGTLSPQPQGEKKKGFEFHACERYWKCDQVWQDGRGCYTLSDEYLSLRNTTTLDGEERKKLVKPGSGEYLKRDGTIGIKTATSEREEEDEESARVVYVNPVEMMDWKWKEYRTLTEEKIKRAAVATATANDDQDEEEEEFPKNLFVPLARHSTLPELRKFVSIFRPKNLYPLTVSTSDKLNPARDYLSMGELFSPFLAKGGKETLEREAKQFVKDWKKLNKVCVTATSSPENVHDDDEEESEMIWNGDGESERAVREKKGLNIEGGKQVLQEVLEWTINVQDEARTRKENGGVRDLENQFDVPSPSSSSTGQVRHDTVLKKSVTFAPPTTATTTENSSLLLPSSSSSSIVPMKRTRSLPPPLPFSSAPAKSTLSSSPSSSSIQIVSPKRTTASASASASASSSNSENSAPFPPVTSLSQSSAHQVIKLQKKMKQKKKSQRAASSVGGDDKDDDDESLEEKDKDKKKKKQRNERLILSIQRTLQGRIGCQGDIIPFTERERECLKRREKRFREKEKGEEEEEEIKNREEEKRKGKQKQSEITEERDLTFNSSSIAGQSPVLKGFGTVGSSY
jgi:hypothetical protein